MGARSPLSDTVTSTRPNALDHQLYLVSVLISRPLQVGQCNINNLITTYLESTLIYAMLIQATDKGSE